MTRDAGRAVSTGLLAAVAALVWLTLFYGVHPSVSVDFDTAPARLLTGVYPVERDPEGRAFAWTSDRTTLRLPGLDRTDIELVADPTLPPGTNASRLEVISDSGELRLERLGKSMPDNPKTGVLTALTMADDLMKMVRASDW